MNEPKIDTLAALRALAAEEELAADNALTPEEAERADLAERIDAARERKRAKLALARGADMLERLDAARKQANGAYVIQVLDVEEQTEGAGCYLVRSPDSSTWKTARQAIDRANGDREKVLMAYRNMDNFCIVYPKVGVDVSMEDMLSLYDKYPMLAESIGDFAGKLGGLAAGERKRKG